MNNISELIDLVAEQCEREREVDGFWVHQLHNLTYVCSAEYEVADLQEWRSEEEAIAYFEAFTPEQEDE